MMQKISTATMSREDWLQERRGSLGGSDMGAVLGLNHYASPFSVWADKTGRTPPQEDNEAMRIGRDLEDYVARRFTEASGLKVQRENYLLRNDSAPHLHANIDRRVVGRRAGLECKTASALNARRFAGGEFPESYYAQCVTYLAVTEWDRWYLAVLILGRGFLVYQMTTVPDDEVPAWCEGSVYVSPEEIQALKIAAVDFWGYVERDEQPPVDGTDATGDALQTIYAEDNGGEVSLMGRESLLSDYFSLKAQEDALKQSMEAIRQTIMEDMGEAATAICEGYKVSWKAQERKTFDAKAFQKDHPREDLSGYYKITAMRPMKITEVRA
jgi:putative phage-type endonuclease